MVAEIKWIKLAADIFENRKIKQIEVLPEKDAIIVIWMKLLCLAGNINDGGQVYFTKKMPYTTEMLAAQFSRPEKTIELALDIFEEYGMIESDADGMIWISNWEKYQNIEGMEKVREQNRIRKQRERARKKETETDEKKDSNVTSRDSHAADKRREEEKRLEEIREREREKERELAPPPSAPEENQPPQKKRYGIHNNVLLSDEERDTLVADFPEDAEAMIENLSEYMKSTGKIYADHYATIRKWAREDAEKAKAPRGRDAPKKGTAAELDEFYNRMATWAQGVTG